MRKTFTLLLLSALIWSCSKDSHEELEFVNGGIVSFGAIVDPTKEVVFEYGQTRELDLGAAGKSVSSTVLPQGWTGSVNGATGIATLTAPAKEASAAKIGTVNILFTDGAEVAFGVGAWEFFTLDFESVPEADLAGPTSYGDNLYSFTGYEQFISYTDPTTGLKFGLNNGSSTWEPDPVQSYEYWYGGIAASQWNDMDQEGYGNQCSVYYEDPVTGYGGHNGSKTFAVSFGYSDFYNGQFDIQLPYIELADRYDEAIFDNFWVTNNTYAVLSMMYGDGFAKKFSYTDRDWFLLTIIGYDVDGFEVDRIEEYLADFRTEDAPGILTTWKNVDLSSLGYVHRISFNLSSSDSGYYGLNTPSYFCFDDLVIRR